VRDKESGFAGSESSRQQGLAEARNARVAIVGGGFTGLAAAVEFTSRGIDVELLEAESGVGGLAAAFEVGGEKLDRFYHHWFTNDHEVMQLIEELGLSKRVEVGPTNTGLYFANKIFRLSTPTDVLRFTPLRFIDRLRLGLLVLRARRVRDWRQLESKSASQWLRELGGDEVYRVVWQPLLKGKFGPYAEDVSAVWFWNKLKLRGGSRGKGGEERLAYFKGGFVALADAMVDCIRSRGGTVSVNQAVSAVMPEGGKWRLMLPHGSILADRVVVTTALPLLANMVRQWAPEAYLNQLRRVRYIGNVCLVLELSRSLSSTYWLNVNDPAFPFVGIIEHTNFERPETYGGRHIVYLSKYVPHSDPLFAMGAEEFYEYAIPFVKRMFPMFDVSWVLARHLWRAHWSQPIVERHYSQLMPGQDGPLPGLHVCSMAQIYPEDRGTNYAIREGRALARRISAELGSA